MEINEQEAKIINIKSGGENYRVRISRATNVKPGDYAVARDALAAIEKTGGSLSVHLVTDALERVGYSTGKQDIPSVPFNLERKVGESGQSENTAYAWQISTDASRLLEAPVLNGKGLTVRSFDLVVDESDKIIDMAVVEKGEIPELQVVSEDETGLAKAA